MKIIHFQALIATIFPLLILSLENDAHIIFPVGSSLLTLFRRAVNDGKEDKPEIREESSETKPSIQKGTSEIRPAIGQDILGPKSVLQKPTPDTKQHLRPESPEIKPIIRQQSSELDHVLHEKKPHTAQHLRPGSPEIKPPIRLERPRVAIDPNDLARQQAMHSEYEQANYKHSSRKGLSRWWKNWRTKGALDGTLFRHADPFDTFDDREDFVNNMKQHLGVKEFSEPPSVLKAKRLYRKAHHAGRGAAEYDGLQAARTFMKKVYPTQYNLVHDYYDGGKRVPKVGESSFRTVSRPLPEG